MGYKTAISKHYKNVKIINDSNIDDFFGILSFAKFKYVDLSSFDFSKVILVSHMFISNGYLKEIDLSNFGYLSLINMKNAWRRCFNLKTLNFLNLTISLEAIVKLIDNTSVYLQIVNHYKNI